MLEGLGNLFIASWSCYKYLLLGVKRCGVQSETCAPRLSNILACFKIFYIGCVFWRHHSAKLLQFLEEYQLNQIPPEAKVCYHEPNKIWNLHLSNIKTLGLGDILTCLRNIWWEFVLYVSHVPYFAVVNCKHIQSISSASLIYID